MHDVSYFPPFFCVFGKYEVRILLALLLKLESVKC
jgi:hypothetical protein